MVSSTSAAPVAGSGVSSGLVARGGWRGALGPPLPTTLAYLRSGDRARTNEPPSHQGNGTFGWSFAYAYVGYLSSSVGEIFGQPLSLILRAFIIFGATVGDIKLNDFIYTEGGYGIYVGGWLRDPGSTNN